MKKMILCLLVMVAATVSAFAQTSQDPDSLYTKELLPVGTDAPSFPALKKGQWNVIDFWATWCPDCRKEIPTVKELYDLYGSLVNFVGVSFDTKQEVLDKYVSDNGIAWTQYSEMKKWKETEISKAYHIQWIPTMYLISPEGKVYYFTVEAQRMGDKLAQLQSEGII